MMDTGSCWVGFGPETVRAQGVCSFCHLRWARIRNPSPAAFSCDSLWAGHSPVSFGIELFNCVKGKDYDRIEGCRFVLVMTVGTFLKVLISPRTGSSQRSMSVFCRVDVKG